MHITHAKLLHNWNNAFMLRSTELNRSKYAYRLKFDRYICYPLDRDDDKLDTNKLSNQEKLQELKHKFVPEQLRKEEADTNEGNRCSRPSVGRAYSRL